MVKREPKIVQWEWVGSLGQQVREVVSVTQYTGLELVKEKPDKTYM